MDERFGNLFEMYHDITAEDPYNQPMRIYPAPHYSMGGLWVDYDLMSTVPGLFVIGEANADGSSHVRSYGENIFGFEDLRADQGSDFDYNDLVVRLSVSDL